MRPLGLFNLAAMVLAITVAAIAFVLVPEKAWTNASIASLVIFALAVSFIFYVPSVLVREKSGSDAAQMASLGPLGFISGVTLLLASAAFVSALAGMEKMAMALDIFALGTLISFYLMLRAALSVVSYTAAKYSGPSSHLRWQNEINSIVALATDSETKTLLDQLAVKLRYAPSDVGGGSPQDSDIDIEVKGVEDSLLKDGNANITNHVKKIELLIAQRDVFLRSARSKA